MIDKLIAIDIKVFLWLNSYHSPVWDSIMWHISGKLEWLPLYLILAGYIVHKYRLRSIAILLAIAIAITLADQLSVILFKETFQRLRPSHNPQLVHLVHIVNNYRGGSYGFISGHATNSFTLAIFLTLLLRKRYFSILLFCWAGLVSYSRIYLGVHYPADIVGGAIFGSSIAGLVYFLYEKGIAYFNYKKERAVNG